MATGRIGTTPVLQVRWSKAPSAGTTSLSGLDDNSVSLVYSVGYEAVYRNGVLLSRTNDYTATNGTTITLIDATIAGDIIEVFANNIVPLTDTYSQGVADSKFVNNSLVDAKGDIITATAADTPARLAVGANGTYLQADSSTATGLKWATVSAGGMTELATGSLSGSSVSITSISGSYKSLELRLAGVSTANNTPIFLQFNSDATNNYSVNARKVVGTTLYNIPYDTNDSLPLSGEENVLSSSTLFGSIIQIPDYTATGVYRVSRFMTTFVNSTSALTQIDGVGTFKSTSSAITSIQLKTSGSTFDAGTYTLYGVS